MSKYNEYICLRPFTEAQIMGDGNVYGCCPSWVDGFKLGNLNDKTLKEIWNDIPAQEFRKSILDGTFKFCNEKSCPLLQSKTADVIKKSDLPHLRYKELVDDIIQNKTILDHDPYMYQLAYDRSCNLSCPSCRKSIIYATGEERELMEKFQSDLGENIKTSRRLTITPSGDAFASITYRKFLQTLTEEDAPMLEGINILTNGLLIKKYWNTLSDFVKSKIDSISVSVDATTSDVYSIVRRGGNFNHLVDNLIYIRDVIKPLDFAISTVIQKNNYKQLHDFISFAKILNCKRLQYQIFEPDFRIGEEGYLQVWLENAVQEKTNPYHEDFLRYVKTINLKQENLYIDFGPLLYLKQGMDISQLEKIKSGR